MYLPELGLYIYSYWCYTNSQSKSWWLIYLNHAVNAGLDYNDVKWDAHLDIRGVIDRPGPAANIFPRTTYWITDISANYRVRENVTVFGRVNNLFDTYYAGTI